MALILAFASVVATGCVHGAVMTDQEIETNGRHTYAASMDKVHAAALAALKGQGYDIALDNQEKGLIKTGRKDLMAVTQGSNSRYSYSGQTVMYTKQLALKLVATEDGKSVAVTARPSIYQGDADISTGAIWALEGPRGERALWAQLFKDIEEAL